MTFWQSLSRRFPAGRRRTAAARQVAAASYMRVFSGNGTTEDAQTVLADLASFTGFYRVNGPGFSAEDRAFSDGMRAAYGRIFGFLRLSGDELAALEKAARREAVTDHEEGTI